MLKLFKVLDNRTLAEMQVEELAEILQQPGGLDSVCVGLFHDPCDDSVVRVRPLPEQPRWGIGPDRQDEGRAA